MALFASWSFDTLLAQALFSANSSDQSGPIGRAHNWPCFNPLLLAQFFSYLRPPLFLAATIFSEIPIATVSSHLPLLPSLATFRSPPSLTTFRLAATVHEYRLRLLLLVNHWPPSLSIVCYRVQRQPLSDPLSSSQYAINLRFLSILEDI